MALDKKAIAISMKYTDDTANALGAVKGAPCQIKSIVKKDGQNIVTFLWVGDDGTELEGTMIVEDGTPIYVWESGKTYHYGDLVIYESAFYRCIAENSDLFFDSTKYNEIGSADGNYDIVEKTEFLPVRFTAADRKMYYSIEDECFWLWNGEKWVKQAKYKGGFGIKFEIEEETGDTIISTDLQKVTSEEVAEMWED